MPDLVLESKFINQFIVASKRDRYLGFLQNEKTRVKFVNDISTTNFLLPELFDKIGGNERETILKRIKQMGNVQDCYIISENEALDRKRLATDDTLAAVIGADAGALLIFVDAEIVYCEGEGMNNRWINKAK